MKELETLSLVRLTQLEFGQHVKNIHTNITAPGDSPVVIHDTVLVQYLGEMNLKSQAYDKGLVQVAKSDETAKIVKADDLRDKAFTCVQRFLSVFEFSPNTQDLLAHASLDALFDKYKGMHKWNFEEETNGIDKLVSDLRNDKYSAFVTAIGMTEFVDRLQQTNDDFKAVFNGRTLEVSSKEVFNVKELRKDLKASYEKMVNYVLTMYIAVDTEEFNNALNVINTIRKYYADMLARRKAGDKTPAPSVN